MPIGYGSASQQCASSAAAQPVSTASGFVNDHAIIIGIDHYVDKSIRDLSTAVNDARKMADILTDRYQYQVDAWFDNAVTRDDLRTLFWETLPKRIGADDRLLVYFAGHGLAADSDLGPAGSLVPHDARYGQPDTYWAMSDFYDSLHQLPCRHLLVVLDCCFAGSFRWASSRDLPLREQILYRERYERCVEHRAWQALTSAAHDQLARDQVTGDPFSGRVESGQHSPFACALFAALRGDAEVASPQERGRLTVTTLYAYLRDAVPERLPDDRRAQIPGLWPLPEHDGRGEFVFVPPADIPELTEAPTPDPTHNPYQGLKPYNCNDRARYFGRERVVADLSAVMGQAPVTLVIGESGAGKSSLLQAGLIPALQDLSWHCNAPVRPQAQPETCLAAAAAQIAAVTDPQGDASDEMATTTANRRPVLVAIDQFEEIYTRCDNTAEQQQFFVGLRELLHNHRHDVHIVASLRSEFEVQVRTDLKQHNVSYQRFPVPPMTQDELRAAILGPAQMSALFFEPPELVDKLVNEVLGMRTPLPLLSYALSELYLRHVEYVKRSGGSSRALREADYEDLGGVIGVLDRRTEDVIAAHQHTARRVLLRLIDNQGGEWTRRRVYKDTELDYGDETENEQVKDVLTALDLDVRDVGLVVSHTTPEGQNFLEPAHDALVPIWARLAGWDQAEQEVPAVIRHRLSEAAQSWYKGDSTTLWNADKSLSQVVKLLRPSNNTPVALRLNRIETRFVTKSRNRRNVLLASGWAVAVALLILLGVAVQQYLRADGLRYDQIVDTARVAASRGDWIKADTSYQEAVSEGRPNHLQLEIERLRGLFALNRRTDVGAILQAYLARSDLGPYRAVVSLHYGDFLMTQGRYVEGKKLIAQALEHPEALRLIDPADELYARSLLAHSHTEAMDYLTKALEKNPFHHRANANLLAQQVQSGRFDEARQRAQRMREFFSLDPLAYMTKALLDLFEGQGEQGLAYLREHSAIFGEAQFDRLEAMFITSQDLYAFIDRYSATDHEHSFADTLVFLGLLGDLVILGNSAELGGFGLDVAIAQRISIVGETLMDAFGTYMRGDHAAAADKLARAHEQHPEAIIVIVQGFVQLQIGIEVAQNGDEKAARQAWARAHTLFVRAKEAPSFMPKQIKRLARMSSTLVAAVTLLIEPADPPRLAALRRNIDWLVDEAEVTARERRVMLEIFAETLPPDLLLRLLVPWLEQTPDHVPMLVLRADAELRAGHYAAARNAVRRVRESVRHGKGTGGVALDPEQSARLRAIERQARDQLRRLAR